MGVVDLLTFTHSYPYVCPSALAPGVVNYGRHNTKHTHTFLHPMGVLRCFSDIVHIPLPPPPKKTHPPTHTHNFSLLWNLCQFHSYFYTLTGIVTELTISCVVFTFVVCNIISILMKRSQFCLWNFIWWRPLHGMNPCKLSGAFFHKSKRDLLLNKHTRLLILASSNSVGCTPN